MKLLFVLGFWLLSITFAHASNLLSYRSIEDLIFHETEEIQEAEIRGTVDLSVRYIDRAESYIVLGRFEKAIDDLEKGYELAEQLHQKNLEQRSLLDMMVAYAYLGDDKNALSAAEHFQNLFSSSKDQNPKKGLPCKDENYVSGPDQAPYPGWCRETVDSTSGALKVLVDGSRLSMGSKESIKFLIDQARSLGLQCCARGGLWKGCVGPLSKKLVEWGAFGVPADPVWD